ELVRAAEGVDFAEGFAVDEEFALGVDAADLQPDALVHPVAGNGELFAIGGGAGVGRFEGADGVFDGDGSGVFWGADGLGFPGRGDADVVGFASAGESPRAGEGDCGAMRTAEYGIDGGGGLSE